MECGSTSAWEQVKLYGVAHSPWVQGIRLALAYHNIPTQLTSQPPSLSWIVQRGPVFPVLQLADGTKHLDSFQLYVLLEKHGYPLGVQRMTEEERNIAQVELERLFSVYALGRCIDGKKWRFISAWSTMREEPYRTSAVLWRALLSLYFWVLIRMGIRMATRKRGMAYNLVFIEQQLRLWEQKLEKQEWLTGETIGFLDFAFWGHLQCMASGLTDELLPIVRRFPRLMAWLETMQDQQSSYRPMYTQRIFEHSAVVVQSGRKERFFFWCGWVLALIFWPLTLVFIAMSLRQRFHNPARTGAVLSRHRRASKK